MVEALLLDVAHLCASLEGGVRVESAFRAVRGFYPFSMCSCQKSLEREPF